MNFQESNGTASDAGSSQKILESWKEIAAYLQREATTAQRWEKEEGLPIHRHNHKSRSSVYAFPGEIDAWRVSRKTAVEIVPPRPRPLWRVPAFAVTILACLMMVGNGIRPQAASAQQKRPIAKRLLCAGCDVRDVGFSEDGRLMVFTDWDSGDLAIRDMPNGKTKRLLAKTGTFENSPAQIQSAVISPDLRQIVYFWNPGDKKSHGQLRIMPNQPGGKSRVLIENPEYTFYTPTAWFPDGKSVLVGLHKPDGALQLARVSVSDGVIRVIKSIAAGGVGGRPGISPDGQYIVYSGMAATPGKPPAPADPQGRHIYVMAADGSSETEIVKTSGLNFYPAWTPDGRHIIFTSNRTGNFDLWSIAVQNGKAAGAESLVRPEIGGTRAIGIYGGSYYYTYTPNRTPFVRIVDGSTAHESESFVGIEPMWSPDGKSVAIKRHRPSGGAKAYELVIRSLETGDERTYPTSFGATGNGRDLWFHDGKSIFTEIARADGTIAAYRIDLKSGDFKELPVPATPPVSVALSQDDKAVYIVRRDGKTPDRIASVNLNTGQERPIFVAPTTEPLSIALSPDGRTLALGWLDGSYAEGPKPHVARVSVDGSDYRDVFTTTDHLLAASFVAWSKDGRSILFNQQQQAGTDHWGVMRVPAEGGGPATLLIAAPSMLSFDVGPDGSRIAYSTSERPDELWALDNVLSALK